MKFLSVLFVFIFLSVGIYAQRNFKDGYIVTNNNDTIVGLIDYRTNKMNGEMCRFKESDTANEQLFYPGDILEYRYIDEGRYYFTRQVEIGDTKKTVFLEYLIQGIMDLYYYYDAENSLDYYFYSTEDGKMVPLTRKPDVIEGHVLREDRKYRETLKYLFADYPELVSKLDKIQLERKPLIELTKQYHDLACKTGEACVVFQNDYKKRTFAFEFSVYSGVQFTDLSVSINNPRFEGHTFKINNMTYPVIGGQMGISNPKWSKWVSLQIDLSLSYLKGSADYKQDEKWFFKYELKSMTFNGRLNIQYTLPLTSKVRPKIQGGLSTMNLFGLSNTLYSKMEDGGFVHENKDKDYFIPYKDYIGFNLGVGLNYMLNEKQGVFGLVSYEFFEGKGKAKDKVSPLTVKVGYIF